MCKLFRRRTTPASALLVLGLGFAWSGCGGGNAVDGTGEVAGDGKGDAAPAEVAIDAEGGTRETGPSPDSGAEDDAAPPVVLAPVVPCTDSADDVYRTPSLTAFTLTARGDVVRCHVDPPLSLVAAAKAIADAGASLDALTGVRIFRIAFRTERGSGVGGLTSARVYLPDVPRKGPLPILVVAHPTEGIADGCASSLDPTKLRDLALPWAARGFAVIAPDYAGLGTEGVQGYQDNRDTAYSVLDASRALVEFVPSSLFDDRVLLVGYSQGGGAVLSARALEATYGSAGHVAGSIVFAAQWAASPHSFGLLQMLRAPDGLTIASGVTKPVVATMMAYAHAANTGASLTAPFSGDLRDSLDATVETLCLEEFGGYLQGLAPTVRQLFDEPLRASLVACLGDESDVHCVEPGRSYFSWLRDNADAAQPSTRGGPILYVQGLLDQIMPPAEEAACNLQTLESAGVHAQVCVDLGGTHSSVVVRNIGFALGWGEALVDGKTTPTCSAVGMPSCNREPLFP